MPRKVDLSGLTTIGIDPGKNSLHLIGLDAKGAIVLKEKVARSKAVTRLANVAPCLIGIEAGMGTHHLAREFSALGHDVRQVPAFYAKPFRQAHKNDFRDALAVGEAVQRPTTRCVPARQTNSSIYKLCIASAHGSSGNALQSSIRSAVFFSSTASPSVKGCIGCVTPCRTFSAKGPMCCPRG